jgi:hypothetical protein
VSSSVTKRGFPALENSITASSAAVGMAKSFRHSGEGSTEGKAGRDLVMVMGMGYQSTRKNNWKA